MVLEAGPTSDQIGIRIVDSKANISMRHELMRLLDITVRPDSDPTKAQEMAVVVEALIGRGKEHWVSRVLNGQIRLVPNAHPNTVQSNHGSQSPVPAFFQR